VIQALETRISAAAAASVEAGAIFTQELPVNMKQY